MRNQMPVAAHLKRARTLVSPLCFEKALDPIARLLVNQTACAMILDGNGVFSN